MDAEGAVAQLGVDAAQQVRQWPAEGLLGGGDLLRRDRADLDAVEAAGGLVGAFAQLLDQAVIVIHGHIMGAAAVRTTQPAHCLRTHRAHTRWVQ
ncbi:hypothetical protein ACQEU3_43670 [Spirillospora sp. CA-253888]